MPYVIMSSMPGRPVIALRTDEKHYANVQSGERVSLLVIPLIPRRMNPQDLPLPKLNITASCNRIVEPETIQAVMGRYDQVHPGSGQFIRQSHLFHFFSLDPVDIFYVMSTQQIDQFRGREFSETTPDPITSNSRELLDELNQKFPTEIRMMCKEYGEVDVDDAIIYSIDRKGFDILGKVMGEEHTWNEFRMPLEQEIPLIDKYRDFVIKACQDVRNAVSTSNKSPSV